MYRECLRIARLFFGLFLYAAGIVLTLNADLGYSPWDVLHKGLALHLGLTIGMASISASVIIVAVSVLMREHVGFGTLCNMIAIGVFVDLILGSGRIPVMTGLVPGLAMMSGGLIVIGLASYFYIGAGYGAGPRDSLMVVLTKRTGRPVGFCRCAMEGTVLFFGWLLGGNVGIGTVLSAFGLGAAVQAVFTLLRFDVRTVRQETFRETCARYKKGVL